MKSYLAQLQAQTQTSYANNGKTTIIGRPQQKTINSTQVIGPALTQFIDVFTTTGATPAASDYNAATGRLFVLGAISASPTIYLYNFNATTGAYSYVGKVTMTLANAAATTHTLRGFKVYETGGLIYPIISTTGSVVINGGTYVGWGLSASDFTPGGTTIFAGITTGAKATYFLQDSGAKGTAHVATTSGGVALGSPSSSPSFNTKLYQQNGTAALPVIYSWDLATTPAVSDTNSAVNSQTGGFGGTAPTAYFQYPGASIPFSANDPVVLTGSVPGGFTATTATAAQTVYFIRDIQLVTGNYYFNLSITSGGAAVVATTTVASGMNIMRAFGTSTNLFNFKTGNLPALTGTILQSNSFQYAKPVSAPANTALNGQDCLSLATNSTLYIGKLSELSSGVTTWPSITPVTASGGSTITAPVPAFAVYSGKNNSADIDRWIYISNTSSFVVAPHQASTISTVFGGLTVIYYEGLNPQTVQFGGVTITNINVDAGWLFVTTSTVGQRGIIFMDISSDAMFGQAAVISPVLNVPAGTTFKYIQAIEQLFDVTDSLYFWIRNGTSSGDAVFSSANIPTPSNNNGWTLISTAKDLSSQSIGPYFQLAATYQIMSLLANTPAQLADLNYTVLLPNENSDNWSDDNDNTTQGTGSPSYASFYLKTAYATSVPTLYTRAYDTSGNLIFSANTSANPTAFQYSTNGGTSWQSLGTIPNTVGTRVRVLVTPTPSGLAFPSIRES
jgi:hypothetical protein